jgi:hypothetical protein
LTDVVVSGWCEVMVVDCDDDICVFDGKIYIVEVVCNCEMLKDSRPSGGIIYGLKI